jgi:hypothetical protein
LLLLGLGNRKVAMNSPETGAGIFGNYDPPQIRLAQKWCWLQWNAATECNIMLPLAAFPKNY